MNQNELEDVVPGIAQLTKVELDERLERAVVTSQKAETLICCLLCEVQERGAYRDFGFSTVSDYARERFGFQERKTRYLVSLGRKLKELPQLREALRSGKLGWCKAVRIARVANREDETMWLDSALSLSVQELDKRLKDQTERLAGMLQFWVTEDVRVLWENGLEAARRAAGVELAPAQAFEYMVAEFLATWGGAVPHERSQETAEPEQNDGDVPEEIGTTSLSLFPFAEKVEIDEAAVADPTGLTSDAFRMHVLERDGWQCRYPGCSARRELHVHHVQFRSHGGLDEPWNGVTLCAFHHGLLHVEQIAVKGRAPHELEWTPPRLMREVLERRRNRPLRWTSDLEVVAFPVQAPAAPVSG